MTRSPLILWLDAPACADVALVGPKAARLATMQQAGLPVPAAFVLTTHAHAEGLAPPIEQALHAAYRELVGSLDSAPVAVRSSATAEDLGGASFAGVQETVLDVRGEAALREAVRHVWASVDSAGARAYRERVGLDESAMAVLVQRQVAARVAGVAFARDPITHAPHVVIEAVAGLGEGLVSGTVEPQRWHLLPSEGGQPPRTLLAPPAPLLDEAGLVAIVALVQRAGELFGGPQDVEWAWDGVRLWMLQARPITGEGADWFTERLPDDHHLWSAAFLNERFTQPVSPLGWSLVAGPLERLALRGPLSLLGADDMEGPLLKRWRGHPYSRAEAWQRIYKLFPDALLPDDAVRFFPDGDLSLRHAPRRPTFGPHLLLNGLRVLRENFGAASPLHNPRSWRRYEQRQAAALIGFRFRERQLREQAVPIPAARALLQDAASLTDELLDLHRWSLLYADLTYSLLHRLLRLRYGPTEGTARAATLTAGVESPTSRMNRALEGLARSYASAGTTSDGRLETSVAEAVRDFLERYGHRFFSLDLYDAPWEADVPAFLGFLGTVARGEGLSHATPPPPGASNPLVRLTRDYLYLREAQRFHWQQLLALQRRVVLVMGGWWAAQGRLAVADDVFGLTWPELMAAEPDSAGAASRMQRLHRLREQARQAPGWHYPDFLRGNTPLHAPAEGVELVGRAVSPGLARGPARLVAHPGEFERLRSGDILVTSSPDPGWTPIFGTVAGMVTERGGQLSHGAVVAREYRLPAVSGIPGVLARLREGEPLLVDGTRGVVVRLEAAPRAAGAAQEGEGELPG